MNISQQKSREIAKLLMAKKYEQYEKLKAAFSTMVRNEYMKTLPKAVKAFYEKFPRFTKTYSEIVIIGNGFAHEHANVERIPTEKDNYGNTFLEPDQKTAEKLIKAFHAMKDAKSVYDDGKEKVAATLFALRTYNRIKEQFPEAEQHLPPAETKAELMNIGEVRKLVK